MTYRILVYKDPNETEPFIDWEFDSHLTADEIAGAAQVMIERATAAGERA